MSAFDWEKIHGAFDGAMPECEGGACPRKCCKKRQAQASCGGTAPYFTSFYSESEWGAFERKHGSLEAKGIRVLAVATRESDTILTINGCLDKKQGCKLKEARPLYCRFYPFRPRSYEPIDTEDCPRAGAIASNVRTIRRILKARACLGLGSSNDEWMENLERELRKCDYKASCVIRAMREKMKFLCYDSRATFTHARPWH